MTIRPELRKKPDQTTHPEKKKSKNPKKPNENDKGIKQRIRALSLLWILISISRRWKQQGQCLSLKNAAPPHCQGTRDNVRLNWQITV